MNEIERQIEEALMRRATDVDPEPGAWSAVQKRVRRSHQTRIVLGSSLAIAGIIAAAFVLPKVMGTNNATPVPPASSDTPTPSVATTPPVSALPQGWTHLRHESDGYWFALPEEWKTGVFEGHTSYRPPGLGSAEEGADTFFVEIFADSGSGIALGVDESKTTVAGKPATRHDPGEVGDGAFSTAWKIPDWDCWAGPGADVNCDPPTLYVIARASTLELWENYRKDAETMVSLLQTASKPMPSGAFRTVHGKVAAGVTYDGRTYQVIRFLEARVFGDSETARGFLSKEALQQYESRKNGLDLYEPESSRGLKTYELVAYREADASSSEIDVRLTDFPRDGDQSKTATATETLGVGGGDNHAGVHGTVIRFATRTAG